MLSDLWTYREMVPQTEKGMSGFGVEAIDGHIGQIDEAIDEVGYIVVDTGHWIFGKKVAIPVGAINNVDLIDQRVYLDLSKDQVKNAPEYGVTPIINDVLRRELTDYYEPIFHGRMEM